MADRKPLSFDPIEAAKQNWNAHGWEAASNGMAMVTSIMRAQQILLASVHQALAPFGLTFAQYEALMLLSFTRKGRLPMGKIGERLQVHPASVTNVIDRLEAKGLVQRLAHPDDARTTLGAITRKGRNLAARATVALNTEVFERTGLPDDKQLQLVDTIAGLRRATGDF